MLAWIVLAASAPAIVCVLSAAYLANQQRPGWGWFLTLSAFAESIGLVILLNLHWIQWGS
jgi:hypothetical protein